MFTYTAGNCWACLGPRVPPRWPRTVPYPTSSTSWPTTMPPPPSAPTAAAVNHDAEPRPPRQGGHALQQRLLHELHLHAQPGRDPHRAVQPQERRLHAQRRHRPEAEPHRPLLASAPATRPPSSANGISAPIPTGFDYWNILPGQGSLLRPRLAATPKGHEESTTDYSTDVVTDFTLDWLKKRDKEKPFFMCATTRPRTGPGTRRRNSRICSRTRPSPSPTTCSTTTKEPRSKPSAGAT